MLWHELVLNGIGGRTIAEAKACMSHAEFLAWMEFRQAHGTLHDGRRIEDAAALVSLTVCRSAGGKAQLADFLPQRAAAVEDDALNAAMREWQ